MTETLYAATGALPSDTPLDVLVEELAPEISLFEPAVSITNQGRGGPLRNLRTVTLGPPDLMGAPVAELRLCWRDGVVHLVADAHGIQWVACGVQPQAVRCPVPAQTAPFPGVRAAADQKVIWRNDLARRFLAPGVSGASDLPEIFLRRFDRGPRTVTWWLTISPEKQGQQDG